MNKILMFIWAGIITLTCVLIVALGYKKSMTYKDDFDRNIKEAVTKYVKKNGFMPELNDSITFFHDEIIKNIFNSEDEINNHCIKKITYYNGLLYDNITIDEDCNN